MAFFGDTKAGYVETGLFKKKRTYIGLTPVAVTIGVVNLWCYKGTKEEVPHKYQPVFGRLEVTFDSADTGSFTLRPGYNSLTPTRKYWIVLERGEWRSEDGTDISRYTKHIERAYSGRAAFEGWPCKHT